jgi:hypothetical protein
MLRLWAGIAVLDEVVEDLRWLLESCCNLGFVFLAYVGWEQSGGFGCLCFLVMQILWFVYCFDFLF